MEGRISWAARPATLAFGVALLLVGTRVYWASFDVSSALGTLLIVAWAVERRPALGPLAAPAAVGAALTYSVHLWHVDFLKAIDGPPTALLVTIAVASAVYVTRRATGDPAASSPREASRHHPRRYPSP
jgi:hypothetical protein